MNKKMLIGIIAVILCFGLVGCNSQEPNNNQENINNGEVNNNQEQVKDDTNNYLNESFEVRTKEATDYLSVLDTYGFESMNVLSRYVSNASLEKKDDYYIMNLTFSAPKLYDKEEIENAYKLAQENGTYTFDGYTFYKDNVLTETEDTNYNEWLKEEKENLKENEFLAKSEEYWYCRFVPTTNDSSKYFVEMIRIAGASSSTVYEEEREMEVILLGNDRMKIRSEVNEGYYEEEELSVEEYYNKNNIDLENVGDAHGYYGEVKNAIEFSDNTILVNVVLGGV